MMKMLPLEYVQEGMKMAKSIYGSNGEILLAAGISLTAFYIKRLKELAIIAVYIEDEETEGIEIDDVVTERTRLEAIKVIKETMTNIKLNSNVDIYKVNQVVNNIIDELLTNKNVLINVIEIRALNDHTFSHSVNVTVLAIITGLSMGFDYEKLKNLALGALFHDIGKTIIPENILLKKEPLTPEEEDLWKTHPNLGFDILRKLTYFNLASAHVALQHHERYDGTGFPRGLKGKKISELARVVSVCDLYDRMTTYQSGQPRYQAFQAIEILIVNSGHFFDPDIVKAFLGIIAIFPLGTRVTLNTGSMGIVVEAHKEYPTRPKVRILYNQVGKKINPSYDIDLIDDSEICVLRVAEEGSENG